MTDSSRSISWRRLGFLGAVWAVLGGGALVFSACYGRNCEGSPYKYGADGGEGEMLDENTWESSPADGTWLPFPRQVIYTFTMPLGGRKPDWVIPYVSGQPVPNTGNFTIGSGNLVEQAGIAPNQVVIVNDTCSDYFVRIVAWSRPFGTAEDAGNLPATATDAGASDSGRDAQ